MRINFIFKRLGWVAVIGTLAGVAPGLAQSSGDALMRGFLNPPASAKPRVWWHWMNGNVTKEGIKLDLEWMKRVGIGGFQNFDAALSTPQIVDKRLVYMTPEWKDAFRYTATLADQFGLEMAIAGSPGWSESGGPWVPVSQAMKKFVWSETRVKGGLPFTGVLPKPSAVTGPFQNMVRGQRRGPNGEQPPAQPQFYADSAVVAYRIPASDIPVASLHPAVTSSGASFNLAALTDGDFESATTLPAAPAGQKAWIQFAFSKPQVIRAVTLAIRGLPRRPDGESGQHLEASDDGSQFRAVATIPSDGAAVHTISFPEVTARFFRVTFETPAAGQPAPGGPQGPGPLELQVSELVLHQGARVNRVEEKAAFATLPDLYSAATPPVAAKDAIGKGDVVDLTGRMHGDGTLDWTPPAGEWIVLRMGYSPLGITNHPASPEATGLEVDKLNRTYVKAYLDNYLGQYKDTVGPLMGKRGLQYVITDSYEAGAQNWTDEVLKEFAKRRGYDPHLWLPALTGRVVESAEASDRFLWDFRKTLGDLMTEYHYDQIGNSLHERGMGRYTESHEGGRAFIGDGMEVKRNADIPMSAMWTPRLGNTSESYGYNVDIRESASVAHIYGQNLVAAESLTAIGTAWRWSPETLKTTADKELAMGLNRFVIHTSVHQPVSDKKPGLGLGPYGQWFTRHETWGELATPWISYLARSSYMLQQGKFVADIVYYYGEDSNVTAIFRRSSPNVPAGYNFDFVNADALVNKLSVTGGRLTTASGMSYRVLALDPNSQHMTLPVLRKIRDLVKGGATVVGPKPTSSPSLSDDPAEFRTLADQVWSSSAVHGSQTLAEALTALHIAPDFEYTKPESDTNVMFVHRKLANGEIYWVDNRNPRVETVDASFLVQGKTPELWYPETGRTAPVNYRIAGGRTIVPLHLDPDEAVFVVFRKPASASPRPVPQPVETLLAKVNGAWEVTFQPGLGAPAKATFDQLTSWSANADAGIKYFSGTATYTTTLQAEAAWLKPGGSLWLDLGDVKNIAEVSVNGKPLGILWKTPFRVNIGTALKPGANTLQVKVTNLWVNRLIGDVQPGVTKKYTYTTREFYSADSPLLPSGLLGPVRLDLVTLK
jgi:hypothetical protein